MILHIDFNSYFATVEQQSNPRLRGKPIGVTGGDRLIRTVIGAASVEAKCFGVKTGMQIWEAKKFCPEIILVPGDSDKYLACTEKFINILKDYSPNLEVFSIDECFLWIPDPFGSAQGWQVRDDNFNSAIKIAQEIKSRIRKEIGEWITCSIGISYNKLMAKLAGSLYKPDGLVVIEDQEAAEWILDRVELDDICGIGSRIKRRLLNMGISNFQTLRKASKKTLMISFKSYGEILYNMARGIDHNPIVPFDQKQEVKSIGHRHTIFHDTNDLKEIKQILLKICEMIGKRLRDKKLVGKTVSCWYRKATNFESDGMQMTIPYTEDGMEIFRAGWKIFHQLWNNPSTGSGSKIRMIGTSISNLKSLNPQNLSLLPEVKRQEIITKTLDKINNKYGEFTLQRGIFLQSGKVYRKPNPFLSDRRFKFR